MKPASRKPSDDLLVEHRPVVAEVVQRHPTRPRRAEPRAQRTCARRRSGADAPARPCARVLARLRFQPGARRTAADSTASSRSASQAAERTRPSVNCQPSSTHRTTPKLDNEVGRGELEGERACRRGAAREQRSRDRDRRVGARGGGGAEPGRQRRPSERRRRRAPAGCARAGPMPARSPEIAKPSTSAHQTCQAIRNGVLETFPDGVEDARGHARDLLVSADGRPPNAGHSDLALARPRR